MTRRLVSSTDRTRSDKRFDCGANSWPPKILGDKQIRALNPKVTRKRSIMILLQDAKDEDRGKGRDTDPVPRVEDVVVERVVKPAWRTGGVRFPTRLQG